MSKILRAVLSSTWMLEPRTVEAYLPLAIALVEGRSVEAPEAEMRSYAIRPDSKQENDINAPRPDSVAVHRVLGVITKFDFCGSPGALTMMARMREADRSNHIVGHVLDIDSGGGEATNIESFARMIREEIQKPVLVHVNGMAASAAYYIAAAADEIYASESTDIFGSIGVMISFADARGRYEREGVKFHEIYADQSDLKNNDFTEARKGEYKPIKEQLLNPYADQFIKTVREFRPALSAEEAFRGRTYMAEDATRIGMIDGIKPLSAVIERTFFIHNQKKIQNTMNALQKISALLGYKVESKDGGVQLDAREVDKLAAHITDDSQPTAADFAKMTSELQALHASITTMENNMTAAENKAKELDAALLAIQTTLTAHATRMDEFAVQPGASATRGKADQEPPTGTGEPDALDALEAAALKIVNGQLQ